MRLFLAATLLALSVPMTAVACSKPAQATALESGMVQWINEQRQAIGLSPLKPSHKLKSAAQGHACDMATRGYFGHQRAGGPKLGQRVKANGYRYRHVAENLALSRSPSVAEAARLWHQSPRHWENLLKPGIREIGLAVASRGDDTYWVMNVGVTH
jgi:uncharacterized protein YkwD